MDGLGQVGGIAGGGLAAHAAGTTVSASAAGEARRLPRSYLTSAETKLRPYADPCQRNGAGVICSRAGGCQSNRYRIEEPAGDRESRRTSGLGDRVSDGLCRGAFP